MSEIYGTFSTAYVEAMRLRLSALEPENKGLAARVAELEAENKTLRDRFSDADTERNAAQAALKAAFARVAELEARCKRLEEALKECDRGFTKHCPDEWSTNGASWKAVREALGRPNPWEKSTP